MTKTKSTKRALLLSALSLLMCVSMLIGSTFAWFTDSVTSAGNIIKSGTLDVTMEWADGTKAVPADDSADWTDASTGAIFEYERWEPGYTEVRHIKIANEGTLALKYQLNIIANGEVSELADVIDVYYLDPADQVADRTVLTADKKIGTLTEVLASISTTASGNLPAGEKHTITLALKMQESAGNEYQDLAIGSDFAVQLLATQLTSESDSFDNQYDKDAMYAVANDLYVDEENGSYVAMSTEGLSAVATLASTDETITSVTYVTDEGEVEVPVVSDFASFNSAIDNNNEIVVLTSGDYDMPDGSDTTLINKELTVVGTEATVIDVSNVDERDQFVTGATLKFEGVTLNFGTALYMGFANCEELTYKDCVINGVQHLYGDKITFDGCTLNVEDDNYMVRTWGGKNVIFNDCTFNCDGKAILVYNQSCNLTVSNCVFNDNGDGTISGKAAIEVCNGDNGDNCVTHNIVVTNTTVNGFDINTSGINTNSTLWANKNSLDDEHLNVTIDGEVVY